MTKPIVDLMDPTKVIVNRDRLLSVRFGLLSFYVIEDGHKFLISITPEFPSTESGPSA